MSKNQMSRKEIRELVLTPNEIRRWHSRERRFRRVAAKFGRSGAWLREVFFEHWWSSMDASDFLRCLVTGRLKIDDRDPLWIKGSFSNRPIASEQDIYNIELAAAEYFHCALADLKWVGEWIIDGSKWSRKFRTINGNVIITVCNDLSTKQVSIHL